MLERFDVIFLEEAIEFISKLELKARRKIFYNIDKAKLLNDPKLFEKLEDDIWYFRTKYSTKQYRIFAFWDKTDNNNTLVIATHGVVKKSNKVSKSEIEKTNRLEKNILNIKTKNKIKRNNKH
jgi:phage-related protein